MPSTSQSQRAFFAALVVVLPSIPFAALPSLGSELPVPATEFVELPGPAGATVRIPAPGPLVMLEGARGGTMGSRLILPDGGKVDPALLDVAALVREGAVKSDGVARVVVRGEAASASLLLHAPRAIPELRLVAGSIELSLLGRLAALPGVERVFLDRELELFDATSNGIIRAPLVWAEEDALGNSVTGIGIKIAIVDTGVDWTHPDLGGCFGSGCKVIGGYDFVNTDLSPMDDHGHGTHVAGIAAGSDGVAPGAKILAYKVCSSSGSCYASNVTSAITRAVTDGADVISMSLGGPGTTDGVLATAADWAVGQGVVVVSSAGNSGTAYGAVGEPAASVRGIAVGASDGATMVASFSSRGPVHDSGRNVVAMKPDLVAPGVSIDSAVPTGSCSLCSATGHRRLSGTSMAAPHVSGAAALLLQAHPTWTPDDVKGALVSPVQDLAWQDTARAEGTGLLDAFGAYSTRFTMSLGNGFLGLLMPGSESFQLGLPVTVKNVGSAQATLSLSTSASGFTSAVSPTGVTLNAGQSANVTLTGSGNNAQLSNRWYEGQLTGTSTGAPGVIGKLSFLRTPLIHFRVDTPLDSIVLWKDGEAYATLSSPNGTFNYTAEPGTYHAYGYNEDGFGTQNVFAENVVLTREAWINMSTHDATSHVPFVMTMPDGTVIDSNATNVCTPGCAWWRKQSMAIVAHDGFDSYLWYLYGSPKTWAFEPSTNWSYGLGQLWVNGTKHVHVGNSTHNFTSSGALRAEGPYASYDTVMKYPPGYTTGSTMEFCSHRLTGAALGYGPAFAGVSRYSVLWNDPHRADVTMVDGITISPVGCALEKRTVERDWTWTYGETPFAFANATGHHAFGGTIQFNDATELDLRYARNGTAYAMFEGPSVAGLDHSADYLWYYDAWSIASRSEPGNAYFGPAANGYTGAGFSGRSNTQAFAFNGSTLSAATSYGWSGWQSTYAGHVKVFGQTPASYLDGAICSASYATEFDLVAGVKAPKVTWAHPNGDGNYGSRFPATADLTWHARLIDPLGHAFTSVDVALAVNESPAASWTPALASDGVLSIDLPELGAGSYDIRLLATTDDGRTVRLTQDPAIIVGSGNCGAMSPQAYALASPRFVAQGQNVTLDARPSTDPEGAISEYRWSVAGLTLLGATVSFQPPNQGEICADLLVTDAQGLTSGDRTCFRTGFAPVADARVSPLVAQPNDEVTFDGSASFDPDGTIQSYAWRIGGELVSSAPTYSARFTTPGTRCGNLTVTDNDGISSSSEACVFVNAAPIAVANASPALGPVGGSITYDAGASYDPDGGGLTYAWAVWDGSTETTASFARTPIASGRYCANVTVADAHGGRAAREACASVGVPPVAVATIATTTPSLGVPVRLDGSASRDDDGVITAYAWRSGAGQLLSAQPAFDHVFTTAGAQCVTLTVTDDLGFSNATSLCVNVQTGFTTRVTSAKPLYSPIEQASLEVKVDTPNGPVPNAYVTVTVRYRTGNTQLDALLPESQCFVWTGTGSTASDGRITFAVPHSLAQRCLGAVGLADLPNAPSASYRVSATARVGLGTGTAQTTYRVGVV